MRMGTQPVPLIPVCFQQLGIHGKLARRRRQKAILRLLSSFPSTKTIKRVVSKGADKYPSFERTAIHHPSGIFFAVVTSIKWSKNHYFHYKNGRLASQARLQISCFNVHVKIGIVQNQTVISQLSLKLLFHPLKADRCLIHNANQDRRKVLGTDFFNCFVKKACHLHVLKVPPHSTL